MAVFINREGGVLFAGVLVQKAMLFWGMRAHVYNYIYIYIHVYKGP